MVVRLPRIVRRGLLAGLSFIDDDEQHLHGAMIRRILLDVLLPGRLKADLIPGCSTVARLLTQLILNQGIGGQFQCDL